MNRLERWLERAQGPRVRKGLAHGGRGRKARLGRGAPSPSGSESISEARQTHLLLLHISAVYPTFPQEKHCPFPRGRGLIMRKTGKEKVRVGSLRAVCLAVDCTSLLWDPLVRQWGHL